LSRRGASANDWVERAGTVLPSGVTHDIRWRDPPGPYFTHGRGARKWDVEGREYVDYVQGHGALLLGLGHPQIAEAVAEAAERGTHLGGNHPAEVEWAELVRELVPCVERVRFTASGTEGTMLALRLARIATGRDTVLRFPGHFHGWHDYALVGVEPPFDIPVSPGIPEATRSTVELVAEDPDAVEARLARRDVAALILEPSGASWGTLPLERAHLPAFADACRRHGTVLIFDEIITGFRVHPGGMQAATGVVPDLCVLGKVLAGGMPGGAVGGRAELFEPFELRAESGWNRYRHVYHPGTFNANPVSAAAGVVALKLVASGEPTGQADASATALRAALTEALADAPVPTAVYGDSSWFHVVPGLAETPRDAETAKRAAASPLVARAERILLDHGVDTIRLGGFVGVGHGPAEIERTVAAYVAAVAALAPAVAS
jgi:glutamate-1-semialdehyde 2,1-aminomutase